MNNVKVKVFTVLTCLIIVAAFLFVNLSGERVEDREIYAQTESDTVFGEITAERSLLIPLHVEDKTVLSQISIMLATFGRRNTCEVDFYLYKNGEIVYGYVIEEASALFDNSYVDLKNIGVTLTPGDEAYLLIASPNGQPGNAVTVWTHSDDTGSGVYDYNRYNYEGNAVAQSARLSLYGRKPFNIGGFAAVVLLCAVIFLLGNRLGSYFSKRKWAIQVVSVRKKSCTQTVDISCALLAVFFCCCILQSACFSQLWLPPVVPVAGSLLILFVEIFFKKLAAWTWTILSIVITVLTAVFLRLVNVDALTKEFVYYAAAFVLCIVLPVVFARKLAIDSIVRLAAAIKKRIWLAPCALIAALGGALIEWGYSQTVEGGAVLRRGWFFAIIVFIVIVFFVKRKQLLQAPEKLFLLIALPIGIFMAVSAPISAGITWDAQIHYIRTVHLSQNIYAEFTKADWEVEGPLEGPDLSENQNNINARELQEFYKSGDVSISKDMQTTLPTSVGYLPGAMGILAGKVLRLPFPAIYILGRIGTFLCYAAAIYYAIKRLINGKILLMVVGLIPTNLFQATTYSYDAWVMALIALSFAYFWGALQRPQDKITFKECAIMIAAVYLGVLPKYIYFTISFILLLIPKEKFPSEKAWRRFLWAVAICAVVSVAYLAVTIFGPVDVYPLYSGDLRGGEDVNGRLQILYIMTHPFTYAKQLLSFLGGYLSLEGAESYITSFAYLGGGKAARTLVMVMLSLAAITDCTQIETLSQKAYLRAGSAVILFGTAAAIATSLYIMFTPVGLDKINGCQPRYLLPLIFPVFALLFHHGTKFNMNRAVYNSVFFTLSLYVAASSFWTAFVTKIVP